MLFFVRYVAIGGIVFCIEVGSFQALYHGGMWLLPANVASYLLAVTSHFSLNRYANFRDFRRSASAQARTYAVVAILCLICMTAVIEVAYRVFGMPPLYAKVLAIVLNFPLGFFGHRYLTFGLGLTAALGRMRATIVR